jgi:hypothetical protein
LAVQEHDGRRVVGPGSGLLLLAVGDQLGAAPGGAWRGPSPTG